MSDYARQDDFSAKSGQTILGAEVDAEFDALVTAVNSKVDESREGAASGIATLSAGSLVPAGISGTPLSGGGQLPEASATALGAVELATTAEANALTDPLRVITAATLGDAITQASGNGLAHTSGVLSFDAGDLTAETTFLGADYAVMFDASANGSRAITGTNLATALEALMSHDNITGFVADEHVAHSGVTITAGNGLTGGGTIAASRTFNVGAGVGMTVNTNDIDFDPSTLSTIAATGLSVAADGIVMSDGGVAKVMPLDEAGLPVVTTDAAQTFALTDANTVQVNSTTARTWTIPANATTAFTIGSAIVLCNSSASTLTITAATGVTLTSVFNTGGTTATSDGVRAGGTAVLLKIAADEWILGGDISDS
jgi:hypothetical protein